MDVVSRVTRHVRIASRTYGNVPDPTFLILFINSICDLKGEHCFYWQSLNRRDDLTFQEIDALSRELGPIENLNLSGGEPFLRSEFADMDVSVCESHPPLGNLRQSSFREIWFSDAARRLRASIAARECYCTNEIFLWPSITFQPVQLLNAIIRARPWVAPTDLTRDPVAPK